jgi:hypothetical protein
MFLLQGPPVEVGGYYKPDPVKESIRLLHCTWVYGSAFGAV